MKHFLPLLFLATAAFAQQPVAPAAPSASAPPSHALPADQQASRADIQRLFQALRLEAQLQTMQEAVAANLEQVMEESIPQESLKTLTPAQRKKYDAYTQRTRARARSVYPVPEMLNDFVPVYQRYFSKSDVDAVVAFYTSPVGTRLLDSQPEMLKEGMGAIMPKLQDRVQKMMDEIRRDAEDVFKDDAPAPNPKS
jgi:hypothetical protein